MPYFLLALLLWSPGSLALQPAARLSFDRNHARRLLSHRRTEVGRDVRARSRRQRRRVARQPHAARRCHQSRPVPVRGARRGERRGALLARLRVDLRRVGDDERGAEDASHVPRVACASRGRRAPVRVVLKKRKADNTFADVWTTDVDPASRFVNAAPPPPSGRRLERCSTRPAGGQGRSARHRRRLHGGGDAEVPRRRDTARRTPVRAGAVQQPPGRLQRPRRSSCPSAASGVNRPNAGVFRRTPLSAEYNIFDSERYVLTLDNRALRDAAAAAPYEFIEILVNERTYGGGGIFNDHATASVDSAFSDYVFVHEFGHHFAALADEYYTSDVAYETGAGAEAGAVGAERHGAARSRRAQMARPRHPGTPVPTPWPKEAFETHSRGDPGAPARDPQAQRSRGRDGRALPRTAARSRRSCSKARPQRGAVGAFEGASYEARGLYRPQADCIMFTRDRVGLLCRHAAARSAGSSICTREMMRAATGHRLIGARLTEKAHQRRPQRGDQARRRWRGRDDEAERRR